MEKKFIVDQKELLNLLSAMQPICSRRTALDTTSTILFQVGHKELILKSTDLEISLQATCSLIESTLEEYESFLVSGKRIFEIVKELESPITCSINLHQICLEAADVSLSLNIKNTEEFPPFPERIENLMHLDAQMLLKMLESVAFLIPQNNANPALNGLLFEINQSEITMTTTDGHCLAQISTTSTSLDEPRSWLMPRRAVYELKKILETSQDKTIFLGTCNNQLVFSGELFNFFTKLLADQFPNYQSILNRTSFVPSQIEKNKLVKTLRRSVCLLSNQFIATQFNFEKNMLKVDMHNKEVGKLNEQLPFKQSEELNLQIRFFAPYLLSGLQAFYDDSLTFYLKNNSSPIIFESQNEKYRLMYLVMPISPTT